MTLALITGAASGIGLATAKLLRSRGASGLVLVDRDREALERAAKAVGGENLLRAHDVADPDAWAETEAAVRSRFGKLDSAVINAGIADTAPIAQMSFERWKKVLAVNLDGAFLTLQVGMRLIRGGAIVLVASANAVRAEIGTAAYGASKAGVVQLMKVAAKEGARDKIRVNAILPGGVTTPIWRAVPIFNELVESKGSEDAAFAAMGKMATPAQRYSTPEEIAETIHFMLSDASGTMTGTALLSDGGYTL